MDVTDEEKSEFIAVAKFERQDIGGHLQILSLNATRHANACGASWNRCELQSRVSPVPIENLWSFYGPVAAKLLFPKCSEAAFTFPLVAIRTAQFQCVTASIGSVTADVAASNLCSVPGSLRINPNRSRPSPLPRLTLGWSPEYWYTHRASRRHPDQSSRDSSGKRHRQHQSGTRCLATSTL